MLVNNRGGKKKRRDNRKKGTGRTERVGKKGGTLQKKGKRENEALQWEIFGSSWAFTS